MTARMYEKNGQPLEKIIRNIVQVSFIRPKERPYKTNNFYPLKLTKAIGEGHAVWVPEEGVIPEQDG